MATTDLKAVELRLRAMLDPYREHLVESKIDSRPVLRRKRAKKGDWFAGVHPIEGAVELALGPMSEQPELLDESSATLQRHKVSASAFRFTQIDETLASELETVVARAFLEYMKKD